MINKREMIQYWERILGQPHKFLTQWPSNQMYCKYMYPYTCIYPYTYTYSIFGLMANVLRACEATQG